MSFFQDLTEKLFPKKKPVENDREPFLREELKRNSQDQVAYGFWLESDEKQQVVSFIAEQYEKSKDGEENVSLFRVLQSGSTSGFMLRYLEESEALHFQHLFDFLKDQVKQQQYIIYTSDVRIYDKAEGVERIERHYLKPSWRVLNRKEVNDTGMMNQLYGNITIELHKKDDQPQFLKLLCQHYADSKFSTPKPFNELMVHLVGGS